MKFRSWRRGLQELQGNKQGMKVQMLEGSQQRVLETGDDADEMEDEKPKLEKMVQKVQEPVNKKVDTMPWF